MTLGYATLGRTPLDEWSARRRDTTLTADIHDTGGTELGLPASERAQPHALGRGYIGARSDTTQQSGQTPDKEVEIKNITVYVSGYTETPESRGR
jgi:hypothetical protein